MKQSIKPRVREEYNISDEKPIYTLIVDGNSLFKRCISVDKRVGNNGNEYGGIFQFLLQIKMMLQKKDFDYIYVFWDGNYSGYFRYQIYNDYKKSREKPFDNCNYGVELSDYYKKLREREEAILELAFLKKKKNGTATREELDDHNFRNQKEILWNILEELFIRQCEFECVEGDDLVAYYVNNKKENEKIIIMTGDADICQLINPDVAIYWLKNKKFITTENANELLGYNYENVALVKTICGDDSDDIAAVSGYGGETHTTLFKYFPEIKERKCTLDEILDKAGRLNDFRKEKKQKPLAALTNLLERNTHGIQGDKIYEINDKLVNLKNPIMTPESLEGMSEICYNYIESEGRDFKNVKEIIDNEYMTDLRDDDTFSSFFSTFTKIRDKEKKREKDFLK